MGSIPGLGRSPEEEMTTHSSILDWRFHGHGSSAGDSPWGSKELEMTEHTYRRFSWDKIYMIVYKENSGMEHFKGREFNFM